MPVLRHVHTYVKLNKAQMKCADPYCTHIQTKDRLVGKITRCAICRETEFILSNEDLRRAKPRCINCSESRAAIEFRESKSKVEEAMQRILNPSPFIESTETNSETTKEE